MNVGPFQIVIIALVILVLFGRGRISDLMGDFGRGVKSFRQGLADEEPRRAVPATPIKGPSPDAASEAAAEPKPTADQSNG